MKKLSLLCACLFVAATLAQSAEASNRCSFSRSLYRGVSNGSDVLCLQKYLNDNGYLISSRGAGSPGKETTKYGGLTRQAVKRWQRANGISGANGVFGPSSQIKYNNITAGSPNNGSVSNNNGSNKNVPQSASSILDKKIRDLVKSAITEVENTNKMINDSSKDTKRAKQEFTKSLSSLFDAMFAYLDNNNAKAVTKAGDAVAQARKSQKEVTSAKSSSSSSKSDREKARDALGDAKDEIGAADRKIDRAKDNGDDLNKAKEILKEAESRYKKADDEYDDKDYSRAIRYAEDAEKLAKKAVDEIEESKKYRENKRGADDAIDDARDKYKKVDRKIDDAEDDKKDVADAKRWLKKADDRIDDARDEFRKEDWDDAIKDAKKAMTYLKEAENAIGSKDKKDRKDAQDAIKDAKKEIEDAEDEIKDAKKDGHDVDKAERLLKDAKDELEDAEKEYRKEDYRDAEKEAKKSESLAKEAEKAIKKLSDKEQVDKLERKAKDSYRDAKRDIDRARAKGKNVDRAKDYYYKARQYWRDGAEHADKKQWSSAIDDLEDSIKYSKRAMSTL